jgi:transcriptional regulator with XRE-family HTH domain
MHLKFDYETLRFWRKDRGLTLREVEKETGISNSYLSQLERGLREPGINTLLKLANIYNAELIEFMDFPKFEEIFEFLRKNKGKIEKLLSKDALFIAVAYDRIKNYAEQAYIKGTIERSYFNDYVKSLTDLQSNER